MSSVPRSGRCREVVVWMLLSIGLVACTKWEVQELTPQQVVSEMKPTRIRVTRSDSARLVFVQPQLAGDSLVGSVLGRRTTVPLAEVAVVAVRKGDPGATVIVVLGTLAAVGIWALAQLAGNAGY
jgi:hypothetical protein